MFLTIFFYITYYTHLHMAPLKPYRPCFREVKIRHFLSKFSKTEFEPHMHRSVQFWYQDNVDRKCLFVTSLPLEMSYFQVTAHPLPVMWHNFVTCDPDLIWPWHFHFEIPLTSFFLRNSSSEWHQFALIYSHLQDKWKFTKVNKLKNNLTLLINIE